MSERLRLRQSGLGWRTLEGEVVALDSPRGVYLGTNQSGRLLWEALADGATREELAQKLVDEYGIARADAQRDVEAFITEVRDQQLIETEDGVSDPPESEADTLDPRDVLERVAQMPITSWSYLWDEGEVRHIGPMAQDFYAAFGLGASDRRIEIADGQGVALAAIQALHELVNEQAREIADLRGRLDRLNNGQGA